MHLRTIAERAAKLTTVSDETGVGQEAQQVDLGQVSLPRLLFALLRQRFSGTVTVQQPPPSIGNRQIWFRGGMPVFTDWVAPAEVLGQVLIAQRTINEDQLLRALEAMAEHGGLLGQHLLQHGALDRPSLLEGLRRQCVRKLIGLFGLRAGTVHVQVAHTHEIDADLLPANALGLILSGVGVAFDETRISDELQSIVHAPLRATASLAKYRSHFRFRPADEPIIDALVSGGTIAELQGKTTAGRRRLLQLVYTLWACQMLRATGPAQQVATPSPAATAPTPTPTPRAPVPTPTPAAPSPQAAAAPVAQTSSPEPSGDDSGDTEFLAELAELEEKLAQGVHAFALFGLPLTATKRDVRGAWGDLSRKFHPDALQRQGRSDLRERVGHVFASLSEAQQILGDAEQREQLRATIEKGEFETTKDGHDATAQAHAAFRSEMIAKEADKLLRSNKFARALERYQEAASLSADEPDVVAAMAWCTYQTSPKAVHDSRIAYDTLATVIRDYPRTSRAHYFLGFVLVDQGNAPAAIDSFSKAGELDPRLIDAQRQARALKVKTGRPVQSARPAKPEKKRGGLRGLFGKK